MPDFSITPAVVKRIADIWGRHGKQLNEEITEAFPDNPDMAFVVAIGLSVGATLSSFSDPDERANMVNGINTMTRHAGYTLTPVN
jgi:hypothetical protein